MTFRTTFLSIGFCIGCAAFAEPTVITPGLQAPRKLALTPRGNLLVAENSLNIDSGRISYVTRTGARRSLVEGMPSGTEVVGGESGPSAMVALDRRLYVAIGGGDTERRGTAPGTTMHNPAGPLRRSSLRYCS